MLNSFKKSPRQATPCRKAFKRHLSPHHVASSPQSREAASGFADTPHMDVGSSSYLQRLKVPGKPERSTFVCGEFRAGGRFAACRTSTHDRRGPRPFFSTEANLVRYPDVAEAGLNALHYETYGPIEKQTRGRLPRTPKVERDKIIRRKVTDCALNAPHKYGLICSVTSDKEARVIVGVREMESSIILWDEPEVTSWSSTIAIQIRGRKHEGGNTCWGPGNSYSRRNRR